MGISQIRWLSFHRFVIPDNGRLKRNPNDILVSRKELIIFATLILLFNTDHNSFVYCLETGKCIRQAYGCCITNKIGEFISKNLYIKTYTQEKSAMLKYVGNFIVNSDWEVSPTHINKRKYLFIILYFSMLLCLFLVCVVILYNKWMTS